MWRSVLLPVIVFLGIARGDSQLPCGQTQSGRGAPTAYGADPDADYINWFHPLQEVNRNLPCWLRFGGEYRGRVEGQYGIRFTENNDLYLLSRFRLNTTIQPTRSLLFFAELQDSRVIFNNRFVSNTPSVQDTWDLRQAYVQIGDAERAWIHLKVGRQVLEFGDARVIGPSDYTNTARTFDAVRVDLRHAQSKLSLFASSVVIQREGVVDHHFQGNNLYGAYGSLKDLIPEATLEPYVLWRVAPPFRALTASSFPGSLNQVMIGVRLAGNLPRAFDYNIEMARQVGSIGSASIAAWGGYWSFGKTFHSVPTAPRLYMETNYASGTKNPNGDTFSTYDEIYPSEHDKLGFADQIGKRNIHQIRAGAIETLDKKRKFSLRQAYINFWLATIHDGIYTNSGTPLLPAAPQAGKRHVGHEVDFIGQYQIDKGLTAAFGYSHIFAGSYLRAVSPGQDFHYPFFYLMYRF